MEVWAAQAKYGFPPADASIRNFEFENIEGDLKIYDMIVKLKQNPLSSRVCSRPQQPGGQSPDLGPILQADLQCLHQLLRWEESPPWQVG